MKYFEFGMRKNAISVECSKPRKKFRTVAKVTKSASGTLDFFKNFARLGQIVPNFAEVCFKTALGD